MTMQRMYSCIAANRKHEIENHVRDREPVQEARTVDTTTGYCSNCEVIHHTTNGSGPVEYSPECPKILKKLGKQIQSMTIVGDCGKQNTKFKGHDAWGGNKIEDTFSRMPRCSTVQVSEYGTSKHCRWCHERVRYGHRPVEVTGQGIV
jgi:hypothetical protein